MYLVDFLMCFVPPDTDISLSWYIFSDPSASKLFKSCICGELLEQSKRYDKLKIAVVEPYISLHGFPVLDFGVYDPAVYDFRA